MLLRLVFGTSQYFVFVDPAKKSAKDPFITFEVAQEEVAKEAGLLGNKNNMSQGMFLKGKTRNKFK